MNTYTKDEIYRLADLYQNTLPPSTPEMDEFGVITYRDTIDEILKDDNSIEDTVMSFVGFYQSAANSPESFEFLHNFIFMMSFQEMFSYAGDSSWKGMIAKWRIELEK